MKKTDLDYNHLHSRLLEEMNARHIRNELKTDTIALLVFGACENHGDHMPFGSDFIFPMELAKRIATKSKKKNIIILPAIPYGVSLHHNKFQMTMSLESHTLEIIIEDLFNSIVRNGIKRILVINGHDGNIAAIESAARVIKDKHSEVVIACLEAWWVLVGEITNNLFEVWNGLGHGGEAETSAMLAVRPDLVNMNNAPIQVIPKLSDNVRIYWKFDELTNTGATGAPRKATVHKGIQALKALENVLLKFIDDMDRTNWKYGLLLK
ncbi:MAG TPA: creatininase family protein [Nitrososphaeraceae archaeon]|jgi:creatinine amidohydrolase